MFAMFRRLKESDHFGTDINEWMNADGRGQAPEATGSLEDQEAMLWKVMKLTRVALVEIKEMAIDDQNYNDAVAGAPPDAVLYLTEDAIGKPLPEGEDVLDAAESIMQHDFRSVAIKDISEIWFRPLWDKANNQPALGFVAQFIIRVIILETKRYMARADDRHFVRSKETRKIRSRHYLL